MNLVQRAYHWKEEVEELAKVEEGALKALPKHLHCFHLYLNLLPVPASAKMDS